MPTQKIVTLYTYDELDAKAQETARDWFREGSNDMFDDLVSYDDFITICEAMGIEVATKTQQGRKGPYEVPCIFWSGFWSQGDGASFAGTFKSTGTAGEAIRAHAPQDEKLHAIGDAIDAITANYANGVTAEITRPHDRYSHEMTMQIDAMTVDLLDEEVNLSDDDDKALTEAIRDLARWFYRYLNDEYDYRNSDEEVAESIRINEYTFTGDGKRED